MFVCSSRSVHEETIAFCRCDTEHREYYSDLMSRYVIPPGVEAMQFGSASSGDDMQTFRHTILMLLLSISMFIGISNLVLCPLWTTETFVHCITSLTHSVQASRFASGHS